MKNNKFVLGSLLAVAFLSLTSCSPSTSSDQSTVTTPETSSSSQTSTSDTSSSSQTSTGETSSSSQTSTGETSSSSQTSTGETSSSSQTSTGETSSSSKDEFECITIAEAIEIATAQGEEPTAEKYTVRGTITKVINPEFGEMEIKDSTGSIYIYGIEGYRNMEDKPLKGDEVVIKGTLQIFNGKPEFNRSDLLDFTHNDGPSIDVDESLYQEMSIDECRSKPAGEKVKLTGVVSSITYGQKNIANGFYLIDNSNSIYIHDSDAVQSVSEGNKITILAERTNWISDKETSNAEKFGYKGCLQVTNVVIKSNDKGKNEFDRSWITSSTVKKIVDTPMTENITTSIYKVNAFVKKQVNPGFTNYYINDLDNKTGSYVYTSNNGSDFAWLDAYDGKLCEVLLSPINCKCSASGTNYRFLPIDVKESTYKMSDEEVPAFVLDYYVIDQFLNEYNANPSLEVLTEHSDEKLGYQDAVVTYESSNTAALEFVTAEGKTKMVTKDDGEATVTMKATYKGKVATRTKIITVRNIDVSDAINVKQAIDSADDTTVKVKGVVVSSLVNKTGFYIGDETGVIAVTTDSETLKKIDLGNMVCMEGKRTHFKKPTSTGLIGQSVILDSTLILNEYGNHEYSKASFDTTKTIDDLVKMDVAEDYSAKVYVTKAKINIFESRFSTNIYLNSLNDSRVSLMLYSSSAAQYSWLEEFNGKEVTLEVALCNWNDKTSYKACVVSVNDGTKTVVNNLNFR